MKSNERRYLNRTRTLMMIFLLSTVALLGIGMMTLAAEITVGPPGSTAQYNSIQEAIDNAANGDTIRVWEGTYTENVNVNKTVSIIGNGSAWCTVQANNPNDHVFEIQSNYVNISGLNITGATGPSMSGVYLGNGIEYCNVSNNNIPENYEGIAAWYSYHNVFWKNTITNNEWYGIILYSSHYNNISCNTIVHDEHYGIYLLYYSHDNTVYNNTVYATTSLINLHGCYIYDGRDNKFINNHIHDEEYGFRFAGSSSSHDNIVRNNTIHGNEYGIHMSYSSTTNIIRDNKIYDNKYGVYITGTTAKDNTIYNNYFEDNTYNAYDEGDNNWNTT